MNDSCKVLDKKSCKIMQDFFDWESSSANYMNTHTLIVTFADASHTHLNHTDDALPTHSDDALPTHSDDALPTHSDDALPTWFI